MNCLTMPEFHMARAPFLVGIPTALCRISSVYIFSNAGRAADGGPGIHDV
jgi:hypothetical protein